MCPESRNKMNDKIGRKDFGIDFQKKQIMFYFWIWIQAKKYILTESIDSLIEDQVFRGRMICLLPTPLSKLNLMRHTERLTKRDNLLTGEGGGGGRGAKSYNRI